MYPILPRIEPSERKFVWLAIGLTMFCVLLPFVLAATVLRDGSTFMGFSTQAPSDTNVYYSMMEQAKVTGHSFFTNVFTPEKQANAFFEPLWAILGYTAGVFHVSHVLVFHVARVLFGVTFLWVAYRCLYVFSVSVLQRRVAFALLAFGMGVGAYIVPFLRITTVEEFMVKNPVDVWVSEAYTFTTLMHSPLFIISQLLLLLLFTLAVQDERRQGSVPLSIFAGIIALLALLHPYDLPAAFLVLTALLFSRIVRDRAYSPQQALYSLRRLLVMGVTAAGIGLYLASVYLLEPGIGGWAKQNITTSPPVSRYILGYGFLLVFAAVAWARALRRKDTSLAVLLLMVWTVVQALLLYMPTQIQRRFTNGLQLALAMLASYAVVATWQWLRERGRLPWQQIAWRSIALWLAPLLFFFTPLYIMARDIQKYARHEPQAWSVHIQPASRLEAMQWLRAQPRGLIFSAIPTSYILSGQTLLPTYAAHGHQTLDYDNKLARLISAFEGSAADMEEFLYREDIRYVFWTSLEQQTFTTFQPERQPYLRLIHKTSTAEIYEVIPKAR